MSSKLSGQITVTTAGTPVAGPADPTGSRFAIRAHPSNTGLLYVGNDGSDSVSSVTGFVMSAGQTIIRRTNTLAKVFFDASVSGEKATWFLLE